MVDAVSAAMKPIVANITNPARNAVHASNNDIITASLQQKNVGSSSHLWPQNHTLIHIVTTQAHFTTLDQC